MIPQIERVSSFVILILLLVKVGMPVLDLEWVGYRNTENMKSLCLLMLLSKKARSLAGECFMLV